MAHLLKPRPARRLTLLVLLVLASATPASAMGAAGAPATTSSTPTFPVPASAKAQTTTGGAAAAGGTAGTPATSGTPTTTYVPAGGATPGASPVPNGSVTTSPTSTTSPTVSGAPTSAPGQVAAAQAGRPTTSRAVARPGNKRVSTAAIVIAVLAALLILGCVVWGLARRRAFEPHWWLSLRHAMAEAGFRASATWAEFSDWVRLGH